MKEYIAMSDAKDANNTRVWLAFTTYGLDILDDTGKLLKSYTTTPNTKQSLSVVN
jgi:hypothetical protein